MDNFIRMLKKRAVEAACGWISLWKYFCASEQNYKFKIDGLIGNFETKFQKHSIVKYKNFNKNAIIYHSESVRVMYDHMHYHLN